MGITPAALKILSDMQKNDFFSDKPLRVMEFGSQEVHCNSPELISEVFDAFRVGIERRARIDFAEKGRRLFEILGFNYECADLDGSEKSLPWNLNTMNCPEGYRGYFSLTTNHGTTEHLIGQDNAFRLMHDLTTVGGYMMHTLPCTGQVNHGFFSYSPLFFYALAEANQYEIKYFLLTEDRKSVV